MTKRRTARLSPLGKWSRSAIATLIALVVGSSPGWGHQHWLIPNVFFIEGDSAWVTFDQTFGDRRFLPSSGPSAYFHLWYVSPDQRKRSVPNLFVGRTRTVGELELTEPGTYRLEAEEANMAWTKLKLGDVETWQPGSRAAFADAEVLESKIFFNKALSYVTLQRTSDEVLTPSGDPLEIVFRDHPNQLQAGRGFQITVYSFGEPISGQEVKLYDDRTEGHDPISTCETTSSATCDIVPARPGRYLLTSELERPTPEDPDTDAASLRVSVTLEVRPEE